jgi:hypothetical protein
VFACWPAEQSTGEAEGNELFGHNSDGDLISDTPGARILSHRQNIQPYGPLLAIQPISRALVP